MTLREELEEAEARAERLRRAIAAADCREAGCKMEHIGGRNAGCELGNGCGCSVPVHVCPKCGDSDYGDNAEAKSIVQQCKLDRDQWQDHCGDTDCEICGEPPMFEGQL